MKPAVPQSERGAALLAVLVLVVIMSGIAAAAFEKLRIATAMARNGASLDQSRSFAIGVETLRTGVRLSNGIAFSPDGATIYHVDTYAGTVAASADDGATWRVLIDDLPYPPDGLTVSSDGDLWIAQYDGACVLRCSPAGQVIDEIRIDAPQATCPAFVGPDLDMLAITSAQENLEHWTDHSGALFLDPSPGATGLPASPWPGSTTHPYWKGIA